LFLFPNFELSLLSFFLLHTTNILCFVCASRPFFLRLLFSVHTLRLQANSFSTQIFARRVLTMAAAPPIPLRLAGEAFARAHDFCQRCVRALARPDGEVCITARHHKKCSRCRGVRDECRPVNAPETHVC